MIRRPAFTLVELLVATAIFAGLILSAVSVLSSLGSANGSVQASYGITQYAQQLMDQMALQISHATSIYPNTSNQTSTWLALNVPTLDSYGQEKIGTNNGILYCTSPAGVFHVYPGVPFSGLSGAVAPNNDCPSNDQRTMGQNTNYTVGLVFTPILTLSPLPSAVEIKLTVQGVITGGETRGTDLQDAPSYTQTQLVEYGNLPFTNEQAN